MEILLITCGYVDNFPLKSRFLIYPQLHPLIHIVSTSPVEAPIYKHIYQQYVDNFIHRVFITNV